MTVRDYRNDSIPLNAKSVYGYIITTSGQDRGMVTRGQVLTRYLRWHITGAAALAAGKVFLWYGRI